MGSSVTYVYKWVLAQEDQQDSTRVQRLVDSIKSGSEDTTPMQCPTPSALFPSTGSQVAMTPGSLGSQLVGAQSSLPSEENQEVLLLAVAFSRAVVDSPSLRSCLESVLAAAGGKVLEISKADCDDSDVDSVRSE